MLALAFSLLVQAGDPVTADCATRFERTRVNGQGVHVTAQCPADVPEADALQSLADELFSGVRLQRDLFDQPAPSVRFTFDPAGRAWTANPQRLAGMGPRIAPSALQYNVLPVLCVVGGTPEANGRVDEATAECRYGRSRYSSDEWKFDRAMRENREAAERWMRQQAFLPGSEPACISVELVFNVQWRDEANDTAGGREYDVERFGIPDHASVCP